MLQLVPEKAKAGVDVDVNTLALSPDMLPATVSEPVCGHAAWKA